MLFSYQGTNFLGWQRQKRGRTVQGEIERALSSLFQREVPVFASGRTDRGAHALGQTAHFEIPKAALKGRCLIKALNHLTPPDISFRRAQRAPDSFHARFSAEKKTYFILLSRLKAPQALMRDLVWRLEENRRPVAALPSNRPALPEIVATGRASAALSAEIRSAEIRSAEIRSAEIRSAEIRSAEIRSAEIRSAEIRSAEIRSAEIRSAAGRASAMRSGGTLDIRKLNLMSKVLIGKHDFKGFQNSGSAVSQTIRCVFEAGWREISPSLWMFQITADGFLRQMARNTAGAQAEILRKNLPIETFQNLLESRDRSFFPFPPAPACGLYLKEVVYPPSVEKLCHEL